MVLAGRMHWMVVHECARRHHADARRRLKGGAVVHRSATQRLATAWWTRTFAVRKELQWKCRAVGHESEDLRLRNDRRLPLHDRLRQLVVVVRATRQREEHWRVEALRRVDISSRGRDDASLADDVAS